MPAFGAALASVHVAHEAVDEPAAEKVPDGHEPTTALLVAVQAVLVSWPGTATAQVDAQPVCTPPDASIAVAW